MTTTTTLLSITRRPPTIIKRPIKPMNQVTIIKRLIIIKWHMAMPFMLMIITSMLLSIIQRLIVPCIPSTQITRSIDFNKTPKPPECTKLIRVGFFGLPDKFDFRPPANTTRHPSHSTLNQGSRCRSNT